MGIKYNPIQEKNVGRKKKPKEGEYQHLYIAMLLNT